MTSSAVAVTVIVAVTVTATEPTAVDFRFQGLRCNII